MAPPPRAFSLSPDVVQALRQGTPIVALESTVITHGLPFPQNLQLARDMEAEVREGGALPATVAVLDGRVRVGLSPEELDRLAAEPGMGKISTRDFAAAVARTQSGGTTVAGTLFAAQRAGLRLFATGGIGGVHRQPRHDVSADLTQLAHTPLIVVCAGAKAILDLPATLEHLETAGVPVIGYQTDEFPAFYARDSGLTLSLRAESAAEVAELAAAHWDLGMRSALLVARPPPAEVALPREAVERAVEQALDEAQAAHIRGPAMTPFLLERVSALTGGASLKANLGLLRANARLAAEIARCLPADPPHPRA